MSSASIIRTRSTGRGRPAARRAPSHRRTTARSGCSKSTWTPGDAAEATDRDPAQQRNAARDVGRRRELIGLGVDVEMDVGERVGGHEGDRVVAGRAAVAAGEARTAPPGISTSKTSSRDRGDDDGGEDPVAVGRLGTSPHRRRARRRRAATAARRPRCRFRGPSHEAPARAAASELRAPSGPPSGGFGAGRQRLRLPVSCSSLGVSSGTARLYLARVAVTPARHEVDDQRDPVERRARPRIRFSR